METVCPLPFSHWFFLSGWRRGPKESVGSLGRRHMVAVWLHHHRLVHRQLGRFPDRVSTRNAGRIAGGLVEAVQDPIFSSERIGDNDLLREDGLHRGEVLRVRFTTLSARLRRIVTCIGPNQKNQPNLDLYLVRRYKICHFPIVVSYLCIGQNQKNQPNLVLYLVWRSKIFVSVATLGTGEISVRPGCKVYQFVQRKLTSQLTDLTSDHLC